MRFGETSVVLPSDYTRRACVKENCAWWISNIDTTGCVFIAINKSLNNLEWRMKCNSGSTNNEE